jgi:hypothetical protein
MVALSARLGHARTVRAHHKMATKIERPRSSLVAMTVRPAAPPVVFAPASAAEPDRA